MLPADARKPVLQGWAVVDNTVGQGWTNVELSLVAGAPQSFVQEISQPYYARRPVVPLPPAFPLQPLIDKRTEIASAEARLAAVNGQIAEIDRDQQRVRENMKALGGNAEERALTQRYTRQLADQEDKLAALRDEQKKAAADRDARRRELAELASRLTFEIGG